MSFTPPTDLTPYKPAANVVTVTPIASTVPDVDQYQCSPPDGAPPSGVLSVTAGTSRTKVDALAAAGLAEQKFFKATISPFPGSIADRNAALSWFMQHIGRPFYPAMLGP